MEKYENEIKIVFNQDTRDRYNKYYKNNNPRTKKPAIDDNIPVTMNKFTSLVRIMQNSLKQKWSDYAQWVLNDMNLQKTPITDCEVEYHTIMPTKRRFDLDNVGSISCKTINDAITKSGLLWEDDSYDIVRKIIFTGEHIKDVRELHITIRY